MLVCVHMCAFADACVCVQKPEEVVWYPVSLSTYFFEAYIFYGSQQTQWSSCPHKLISGVTCVHKS